MNGILLVIRTSPSVRPTVPYPRMTRCPSGGASVSGSASMSRAGPRAQGGTRPLVARAAAEAIEDDRRVAIGARIIETTEAAMATW